MKSKKPLMQLKLAVPADEARVDKFLTASGTFQDGDLRLNQKGLRLINEESGSQPSDVKELDTQVSLEDLETVKVIGKGSGGVVQLVRHKWLGTLYALKGIQMNIQETVRKQIVQELKINQSSQCPHVVVCYHSFYHNDVISLLLEYMDRGSLVDIIKQVKTILEPYLAVVCKQVLQGLVYLHHERHVIHRDIKPSNLLVNHKGEVKITDFGVSVVLASSMGQRDTFVGTYNYMAPERISGGSYDYKSDIWSLGLVTLECAIGRFPYIPSEQEEGWLSFYELLEAIVEQPPPTAPSDQFSPEFCSFISSCVQKDPNDRMSSLELLAITASSTKKNGLIFGEIQSQLKNKNITVDVKANSDSNLFTTITVDELATPGLKSIISFVVPDQKSGKVELQYLHEYAGVNTSIGLTASPIVNLSGVFGTGALSVGADVSLDTATGNFTKYNAGLSLINADLIASLILNGKGDSLTASYYHLVNPLSSTAVGAELTHSFSGNESTLTFGTQHSLDPLTMVKARIDNYGKACALIQHQWRPKSFVTVSGEVDTRTIEKSSKVGLSVVLKP